MYCLVVGQTLGTLKPLVTLIALVEPLLFIAASQIRPPNKVIVPETCGRGENEKLNHASEIYIELHQREGWLDFGSELAVRRLHVTGKVASSGFHFSTFLTRGLSFVHCCVVRQTLVGSEGLFAIDAVELLGLRVPIIA